MDECEVCTTNKGVNGWLWVDRRTVTCAPCGKLLEEAYERAIPFSDAGVDQDVVFELVVARRQGRSRAKMSQIVGSARARQVQSDDKAQRIVSKKKQRDHLASLLSDAAKDQGFYRSYMRSREWVERKASFLARHGKRCRACGETDNIHVHHRSYVRLGEERDEDLRALCQTCHTKLHKYHRHSALSLELATDAFIKEACNGDRVLRKRMKVSRGDDSLFK